MSTKYNCSTRFARLAELLDVCAEVCIFLAQDTRPCACDTRAIYPEWILSVVLWEVFGWVI